MKRRITPAGAGKTFFNDIGKIGNTDHPRRCGENWGVQNGWLSDIGSPPQVRGKPVGGLNLEACRRITPAGAGKTLSVLLTPSAFQDHPRRCGENCLYSRAEVSRTGSPPQVRGKRSLPCSMRSLSRITPAGAGKTIARLFRSLSFRDHPRRCGENNIGCLPYTGTVGSPPQVRGKPLNSSGGSGKGRITPAGAGKTQF